MSAVKHLLSSLRSSELSELSRLLDEERGVERGLGAEGVRMRELHRSVGLRLAAAYLDEEADKGR